MLLNTNMKKPRSEPLFQAVRDRIVLAQYPPGQMLSEKALCEEFHVSRSPYREAVRKLEELKLVKVVPRFGSYVAEIDVFEIKCAYEVRRNLEVLAARLAAVRKTGFHVQEMEALMQEAGETLGDEPGGPLKIDLDNRFHGILWDAAHNPVLSETLHRLHLICSRIWSSLMREAYEKAEIVKALKDAVHALKSGDADKMAAVMEWHMQKTMDLLENRMP